MPKYIIKDGKAIRVDKMQKVEEVKVEEKVEEKSKEDEFEKMTVAELKEIAEKYDIDTQGKKKQELIEEIKNKVGE